MMQSFHHQFESFPSEIRKYMLDRDLDPLPVSCRNFKRRLFTSQGDYCLEDFITFRRELTAICNGNKMLERAVENYLTRLFTFPSDNVSVDIFG